MAQSVWILGFDGLVKELRDVTQAELLADEYPEYIYFYADLVPDDTKIYPYEDGDFLIIGPEAFTTSTGAVISYKGANYFKACDGFVRDLPEGGQSFCVRRVDHPGTLHEDYEGVIRDA